MKCIISMVSWYLPRLEILHLRIDHGAQVSFHVSLTICFCIYKQFVLVVNRWANNYLVGFLASIKYWHTLQVNVWSFLLLFFLNNRGCVGVTSCNDQELAQIAEICFASKCFEFFFSFLIIVGVWVSLLAMIKNWPKL